ncbi:MAG: sulfite exporter TauE/SafE family protein [Candidatus Acidiferrales bacterium]
MIEFRRRDAALFGTACFVGVFSGLLGVGGGVMLVPLLVLLFHYEQHRAQGTNLVALIPPTGFLAFLSYYRAHEVDIRVGLLIIPGVFLGGIAGGYVAAWLSPVRLRRVFAVILFLLGGWEVVSPFVKEGSHLLH